MLYEGDKMDAYNKELQLNAGVSSKKIETEFLHNYLRIRIPVLAKAFVSKDPECKNTCDYDSFKEVVKSLNIHNKYTNDDLLTNIFNKFKNNDNEMKYHDFIDDLHSNKIEVDFYGLKDKVFNHLTDQIEGQKQKQRDQFDKLKKNPTLKKYTEVDHDIQARPEILEKLIQRENTISNHVNVSQPTKEFFQNITKDTKKYFDIQQKGINSISPLLEFNTDNRKTRCGANPPFMNTMYLCQADPIAEGVYMSEKERFNVRNKSEVDFQTKDKLNKQLTSKNRIEKMKEYERDFMDRSYIKDLIADEKRNYSLLQRSKHMIKYETVIIFIKSIIKSIINIIHIIIIRYVGKETIL